MRNYFISPTGRPDAAGTQADPWSFTRLLPTHAEPFQPAPGDSILLARGAQFPGWLEWYYLPDRLRPVSLGCYGPEDRPRPKVLSGQRIGLDCGGSGLIVRDIDFVGEGGEAGIRVNHAQDGLPSGGYLFERISATGYGLAGLMVSVSFLVEDVMIRNSEFSGNANGVFVSAALNGRNLLRHLSVIDTKANDNKLSNPQSRGNGFSLVGVTDLKLVGCEAWRNGHTDGRGHSGFTAQQCRLLLIDHCKAGDTAPGPDGDGQDFVLNSCEDGEVQYCESDGGHIGFAAHDDRIYFEPDWQSRWLVFRHNHARGNTVCYQVFLGRGGIDLHDNEGHTWATESEYRKVLDFWPAPEGEGGAVRLRDNNFLAEGTALLLEAGGPDGLRDVHFEGNHSWTATRPDPFVVQGSGYATLAAALAVVPVEARKPRGFSDARTPDCR